MAITDTRLRILAFPQRWDGASISLRVLVAPFGNPLLPIDPGLLPFAQAQLRLSAQLIPSLERIPRPADVTERFVLDSVTPQDLEAVYIELADVLDIDPAAPAAYQPPSPSTHIAKMLMPSYLQASGWVRPRTPYAVTDNRFLCALADGERPVSKPPQPVAPPKWDSVLAFAVRQPMLAERLGLIYTASVELPDPSLYQDGGWFYVTLDTASDYFAAAAGSPDFLRLYAARIPPIEAGAAASLFAAVLFPVTAAPPGGSYDEMLEEAATYNDGFARLAHTFQPDRADYLNLSMQGDKRLRPFHESGIKLGWDDEQIVIWLNRQFTDDPRNNPLAARDTPLGVRGYRVDVRDAEGPGTWNSLVRMQGQLRLDETDMGLFDGEMAIELAPSQLQAKRDGEYWLPPYFTEWRGGSLIAADETAARLTNSVPSPRTYEPVGAGDVPLRYGTTYQFRVRLTDLTGGGPDADAIEQPTSAVATCRFRRFLPPGTLLAPKPAENADGSLTYSIERPPLGYPALVFTDLPDAEAELLADAADAAAQTRLPGYPDPDVTAVRIDVLVRSLEFDPENQAGPEPRRKVYSTFREFADDPEQALDLTFEFEDRVDIESLPAPAAAGRLRLPAARDLEIVFTGIARPDPGLAGLADPLRAAAIDPRALDRQDSRFTYFGNHAARLGRSHSLFLRRESTVEDGLFKDIPGVPLEAVFLRPASPRDAHLDAKNAAAGTPEQAPESAIQRLSRQLRLDTQGLRLAGRAGRRVVFGASAAIRHVLSPEHGTITFASETEISSQWLTVVPLRLARDWTWDALTGEGLRIFRSIDGGPLEQVGVISPRPGLSHTVFGAGAALERQATDILFFDAIDPKPAPGDFAKERQVTYTVIPQFRQAPVGPAPQFSGTLRLPMAAPPAQTPKIASAGIALSPYRHDERYSSTEPRRRRLWIEFTEPLANPRDAYFARVLTHAPDPMLSSELPARPPGPLEPPLNLDPEPIRSIVANQPADFAGLDAMQKMIPADAEDGGPTRHFLLPLPEQTPEDSPELFGFYVYEFRVGHADGWSLAQSRYGLPCRVSGVQHPAPVLSCSVSRNAEYVRIGAPYALPAANGRTLLREPPGSDLWGLLYAQARMADASGWRNILIGRTKLRFEDEFARGRAGVKVQGIGYLDQGDIEAWLRALALPLNSPLSVVAVELLPEPDSPFGDPLGRHLGEVRMLRVSPLTPVPAICLDAV